MIGNNNITQCFLRIANSLLLQIKAFGQFGLCLNTDESLLNGELEKRYAFTRSYFSVLEDVIHLQFTPSELPVLYNTVDWPKDAPPGGYTEPHIQIKPSQLVITFIGSWNYHWQCKRNSKSSLARPLRAALWVFDKKGLKSAINFVLDLQKNGFILDPDDVAETMDLLLNAYRVAQLEGDKAALFFKGRKPAGPQDWIKAEIHSFDDSLITREIPEDTLFEIINAGLQEIERVRNSTSYDEWLIGQWTLCDHLNAIQKLISKYVEDKSPSLKSVLDHFEEIKADSGGISSAINGKTDNPLVLPLKVMELVKHMMKEMSPQNWKDRLMQERAIIPYELRDYFLNDLTNQLPKRWQFLSPVLTPIFQQVVARNDRLILSRKERFTTDEVQQSSTVNKLFEKWGINDAFTQSILINEYKLWGRVGPSMRILSRHLNQINGASSEYHPDDEGDSYIYDDDIREWLESNKEKLDRLFQEIDSELCADEITGLIEKANQAKNQHGPKVAADYLEQLVEKHPWFDYSYLELGIAYDENGETNRALPLIENAIILRPTEPMHWNSLGVVLNRVGDKRGSALAHAISQMIQSSNVNL